MQTLARIPPSAERPNMLQSGSWLDVSPEATQAGLSGQLLLCPAVWLICVYNSESNADRIDSSREKLRLQRLLRATSAAWQAKLRVAGKRRRSCVFSYEPIAHTPSRQTAGTPPVLGIRLELTTRGNDEGNWITTITLAA
jgi:hypothetical protein